MKNFNINLKNAAMFVVSLAICLATFTGCQKEESKSNNEPTKSNEKQITSFKITVPPREGTINELAKTIIIDNIPMGTIVTALVPNITVSEKATISPASGIAQDFTNPVIYTVTAEDGTTTTYTVSVNVLDERDEWIGEYITTYKYTFEGVETEKRYILKIRKISHTPNGVFLDGFLKNCVELAFTEAQSVYAEIRGNEMTIDSFSEYQGVKFSGSGNRDNRTITIHNTATPQWGAPISFTQVAEKDSKKN